MSDIGLGRPSRPRPGLSARLNRLIASPRFQSWASRFPLTRGIARRDGEALFDLVAGFVHSQVLHAVVELGVLRQLSDGALPLRTLAARVGLDEDRARILFDAATALGLLKKRSGGRYALARRGAALMGVPGLEAMILHHRVLYRDLEDPVAFLRGETEPELARFWPYVFGAGAEIDPAAAQRYSDLMADSQTLVAEETLRAVSLDGAQRLLDVGGGTGAFLVQALEATPGLTATLFDLPEVVAEAGRRFREAGLEGRIDIRPGSFRTDPLPAGHDTISLVRVLYDHSDETVRALLAAAFAALEPGGRLIVSEPMAGGERPTRAGDAYFALYTLAMGTGRTRSAATLTELLTEAGFSEVRALPTGRPFITGVVTGRRPST